MQVAIEIRGLKFSYGNRLILDNISLNIAKGSFQCFLGANGTGKSTLIKILTGQLDYKIGEVKVYGEDIKNIKHKIVGKISILSDNIALPDEFNVYEALLFSTKAFGYDTVKAKIIVLRLLNDFKLLEYAKCPIKRLSTGLRRRVEIAQSLANESDIIFLDEPTNALDPKSSNEIRELIKTINAAGITVIYATHLLAEIDDLYTHVSIISNGQIKTYCKRELVEDKSNIFIRFSNRSDMAAALEIISQKGLKCKQDNLMLIIKNLGANSDALMADFRNNNIDTAEISVGRTNLNMLYNNATND